MRPIPALVCLAWFVLPGPAVTQSFYPAAGRSTVQLAGRAELSVEPDRARISMAVSETKKSVAEAKKLVDERAMRIQKSLLEMGVGRTDISASEIMVHPVREPRSARMEGTEPPTVERFNVIRRITVDVAEIDKLDEILDRALALGANRVWNVALYAGKEDSLKMEAMVRAAADAKRKAEKLASTYGRKIGEAILMEHDFGGGGPIGPLALEARGGAGGEFARGTISITATVNAVFELRQ